MPDIRTASRRRKRLMILAVVAVTLCACVAGLVHFAIYPFNGMFAGRLDADLQASLSVGSTMDEGRTWFARQGIEPSETVLGVSGYLIFATLPNDTLFDTAEVHIRLRYDSQGRLRSTTVERRVQTP